MLFKNKNFVEVFKKENSKDSIGKCVTLIKTKVIINAKNEPKVTINSTKITD